METKKITQVILKLTVEEAKWLHDNMQNPLHTQEPFNESAEDEEMRHLFFYATNIES